MISWIVISLKVKRIKKLGKEKSKNNVKVTLTTESKLLSMMHQWLTISLKVNGQIHAENQIQMKCYGIHI